MKTPQKHALKPLIGFDDDFDKLRERLTGLSLSFRKRDMDCELVKNVTVYCHRRTVLSYVTRGERSDS